MRREGADRGRRSRRDEAQAVRPSTVRTGQDGLSRARQEICWE
jgi:hypothetical protein